jgi:hypothetical protein
MILTDNAGKPYPEPQREDYESDITFLRAHAAWIDLIHTMANRSFDQQLRKSLAAKKRKRRA